MFVMGKVPLPSEDTKRSVFACFVQCTKCHKNVFRRFIWWFGRLTISALAETGTA